MGPPMSAPVRHSLRPPVKKTRRCEEDEDEEEVGVAGYGHTDCEDILFKKPRPPVSDYYQCLLLEKCALNFFSFNRQAEVPTAHSELLDPRNQQGPPQPQDPPDLQRPPEPVETTAAAQWERSPPLGRSAGVTRRNTLPPGLLGRNIIWL